MRKTGIVPDFITIEGSIQNPRSIKNDRDSYHPMPIYEALLFVKQALHTCGLETRVKVIANCEFVSNFDVLNLLALGANVVCLRTSHRSIRNFLSIKGPIGLYKTLNADDIHEKVGSSIIQTINSWGFSSVSDITIPNFFRRLNLSMLQFYGNVDDAVLLRKSFKLYSNPIAGLHQLEKKEIQNLDTSGGIFALASDRNRE